MRDLSWIFKAKAIIKYLQEFCRVESYTGIGSGICRDKRDEDIIALAAGNNVRYLVTGDDDLLMLKRYEQIEIVSPRDFWAHVKWNNG
jgi:predicted nucleic acid-binding protein